MSKSSLTWIALLLALSFSTFGIGGTVTFVLCSSSLILGTIFVLLYHGLSDSSSYKKKTCDATLDFPIYNLVPLEDKLKNPRKKSKQDRRMTGSIIIDEPLHEIIQYALRDYVQSWLSSLTVDEEFIQELGKNAQEAIISFSNRSKEINWVPYVTTELVDDFASHLRLFRKTQHKVKLQRLEDPSVRPNVNSIFFTFEREMENNFSRDGICNDIENEKAFLRDVTDILLFLLIPSHNFENKSYRILLREIIVNYLIFPTLEGFADPDYINQYIVWLCKDIPVTSEVFLSVVRSTDNIDELVAVLESVNHEIAIQRAKDTGGNDDAEIKQRLSSLHYVKKVVETKMQRLNDGVEETDSLGLPSQIDWNKWLSEDQKLPQLPLDFVLKNNITLSYFMDYMTSINCQAYLFFYLNVEGYKVSAEQQLSAAHLNNLCQDNGREQNDLEGLRQAALSIYQTCLSEEAVPHINILDNHQNEITQQVTKKLLMRIRTDPEPSEYWFDEAQKKIYDMFQSMNKFFPNFKKSLYYVKLLAELDLLKDSNKSDDEDVTDCAKLEGPPLEPLNDMTEDNLSCSSLEQDDAASLLDTVSLCSNDSGAGLSISSDNVTAVPSNITITADIVATAKETTKGKSYIVYQVRVVKSNDIEGVQDEWIISRRYSDFHDFHMILLGKFNGIGKLFFPRKKAFNNMNKSFLKKRTLLLKDYLLALQSPYMLSTNKGLKDYLYHFLMKGSYEKEKSIIARRVEDIVRPLKSVKDVVRNVPDSLFDGVVGVKEGLSRALLSGRLKSMSHGNEESGKVGAALLYPENTMDDIPVRILMLLMDEIFDLKSKNLWLRRRIVALLRQVIKATYGVMINRKIVDYVQWMLSAEQVSEYIRSFKESFWPNGILAAPYPERDKNTKMRTRVAAKTAMMCTISDELKHVIGSETFRKGIMCVFEMFQNETLNKRLLYVLLEGIMKTLFHSNNFDKTFHTLHSHFQKIKKESKQKS